MALMKHMVEYENIISESPEYLVSSSDELEDSSNQIVEVMQQD